MNILYRTVRRAAKNLYKTGTLHCLYPYRYKKYARLPVDERKVVFLQIRKPDFADFAPIAEQLEAEGGWKCRTLCLEEGVAGHGRVRKNCLEALRDLADAKYIFVNDSSTLTGCLPLRRETKLIQVWHACGAFKMFGYSIVEKDFGSNRREMERFPLHRNYSAVTVSSPEVVWAYAEAFHMEGEKEKILPVGVPRTDRFFRQECFQMAREKLHRIMPECSGKKIVLYAPTFRGKVSQATAPEILDFEKLQAALGDDTVFLCKYHPFVKKRPELPDACRGFVTDVTERMEIGDLLMVSDICISDYSSLIFEYSLMERPMIFLAYDREEYYDERGFYYPYEEMAPGPAVRTTEEVIELLRRPESWFDPERIRGFREKFMSSCDGSAAKRLLETIRNFE